MKIFILGSINFDVVTTTEHLPKKGETVHGRSVDNFIGGKGTNQAVQAAQLDAEVYFAGNLGKDHYGSIAFNTLKEKGIHTEFIRIDPSHPTGCAVITIDANGDNTLVHTPGANKTIPMETVLAAQDTLKNCDLFITQLEINMDVVELGLSLAKQNHIPAIVNPTPALPLSDCIFEGLDYIVPNETESEGYTQILRDGLCTEDWCRKNGEWFLQKGCKNVVITLGEKGAYFLSQSEELFVPAFRVKPVDTTAAGDSFIGGFARGIAGHMPVADALRLGCACGALTTQQLGAQNSIQNKQSVLRFLQEQGISLSLS